MAVYVYRCPEHGAVELARPIGTAGGTEPCPLCDSPAGRVFTAPRLSFGDPRRRALIDRTERTRDEPAVVAAPPPRRPQPRPAAIDPAWRRLPRP